MFECLSNLVGGNNSIPFWTSIAAFGTVLSAIAAFLVYKVAKIQLNNINETTRTDFLHRYTESFFNSNSFKLLLLIQYGFIKLNFVEIKQVGTYIYFETEKDLLRLWKVLDETVINEYKDKYGEDEIDKLLGYFEDIGHYLNKGLLDISMVYEVFSSYIEITWENEEIKKYIKHERKVFGQDMYDGFDTLYEDIIKYKQEKCVSVKPVIR